LVVVQSVASKVGFKRGQKSKVFQVLRSEFAVHHHHHHCHQSHCPLPPTTTASSGTANPAAELQNKPVNRATFKLFLGARKTNYEDLDHMKFIELFAGVGGFRHGLEAVGGELVWGCDIDKNVGITYRANFGQDQILYNDVIEAKKEFIPAFDLLTAGFPCQDFSHLGAGNDGGQKGLEGETGSLFYQVVRLLKDCQPKAFLLENVHGLKSMNGGQTILLVIAALEAAGYHVQYKVMNSSCLLPQFRRRIYFVGFLDAKAAQRFQFPVAPSIVPKRSVGDILDVSDPFLETYKLSKRQWRAVKDAKASKKYGLETRILRPTTTIADTLLSSYRGSRKGMSQFVMPMDQTEGRPRWLTTREVARLMGFPNASIYPSGPSAYKQLGNAVTPPLIALLGGSIRAALENNPSHAYLGLQSALSLALDSTDPSRQHVLLNSRIVDHPKHTGTVGALLYTPQSRWTMLMVAFGCTCLHVLSSK
jgi:DNA (cytosine-5)-methyltransferase 1